MKTITTEIDSPVAGKVRVKFLVLADTRTVKRPAPFNPVTRDCPAIVDTVETFDNLVGCERITEAEIPARTTFWSNVANGIPNPPPVPVEIAAWRARAVLEKAGMLSAVDAAVAGLTGDAGIEARNAWTANAPLARKGPMVASMAAILGLTSEQLDTMFIAAAAIVA